MILIKAKYPVICKECPVKHYYRDSYFGEMFTCPFVPDNLPLNLYRRHDKCPLIPLTEYEEAQINEILYQRGEREKEEQNGTQQV